MSEFSGGNETGEKMKDAEREERRRTEEKEREERERESGWGGESCITAVTWMSPSPRISGVQEQERACQRPTFPKSNSRPLSVLALVGLQHPPEKSYQCVCV